jgi:hypothetical protein
MRYNWRPPTDERVPINIHPEVRDMLHHLLMHEFAGTGVGYSAFIYRAVKDAGAKWHDERNESRPS